MSRRPSSSPRKTSTKLRARIAAKPRPAPEAPPASVPSALRRPDPCASEAIEAIDAEPRSVDRPTLPEVPEARRSSAGDAPAKVQATPVEPPSQALASRAAQLGDELFEPLGHAASTDDDRSLSDTFFASDPTAFDDDRFDSLAPISTRSPQLAFDDADTAELEPAIDPAQQARQQKLRRAVFGVVGAVALSVLGLAVARPLFSGGRAGAESPTASAQETPLASTDAGPQSTSSERSAEAATEPAAPASPAALAREPAPQAEPTGASAVATPALGSPNGGSLTRQAITSLERGRRAEAIELADRAIAQDPSEALGYLIKASALLDQGDPKGARAAFDACVTHAKKGSVYECAALGGRKLR